ncbi:hypothetical protein [uncultured Shimia sp.]|uniref:hypothetical protein n=1 Tax=uncultured Shimia sp. TaxID=573152 RepID=UPI00261EFC7A|nr:hypothetical protein [uncultured Shimia sp.]
MSKIILILTLLATPLLAQDLEGNDTPGNWRVTHHEIHDIWNVLCDEREEQGALKQRCYIRYVDVFSPRPKFAAQFLFVTPSADKASAEVDFGMEAGTLFLPGAFRIERDGTNVWQSNWPGCLTGLDCTFTGDSGAALLREMRAGGAFRFTFRDRHGQPQDLIWPLDAFGAAWDDFATVAEARDLMN